MTGDKAVVWASHFLGPVDTSFGNSVISTLTFDLDVFQLEPEVPDFEFDIKTAMQLATAAYATIEDNPQAPDVGDRADELSIYLSLFDGSTDLRVATNVTVDGVQVTDSKGFFVKENAAALVAQTDDALIIAFRGTNDNEDTFNNVAEALFGVDVPNVLGSQFTGRLAAWNAITNGNGKGKGLDKIRDKAVDKGLPEEIDSPDVEDWFDLTSHFGLFDELIAVIPNMLEELGLTKVLFTGHSLGGGMVQYAMSGFEPGDHGATYQAFAFAPSGVDDDTISTNDPRILNITFENDPIHWSSLGTEQRGDTLRLFSSDTGGHETKLYLEAAQALYKAGLRNKDDFVNGEGERLDLVSLRVGNPERADIELSNIALNQAAIGTDGNDTIDVDTIDRPALVAGLGGDDEIDLFQAIQADTLIFRNGDGNDTVFRFDPAEDRVALSGFQDPTDYQIAIIDGGLFFDDTVTLIWNDTSSIEFQGVDSDVFVAAIDSILITTSDYLLSA